MKIKNIKQKSFITLSFFSPVIGSILYNKIVKSFAEGKIKEFTSDSDLFYESDYGRMRYQIDGKGYPLLLIHDIIPGSSMLQWEKNIDELKKHFTVYRIDLPGFGLSDKNSIIYTGYQYSVLINQFIQDVICKPVYFSGIGFGAAYGILAAKLVPSNFKKMLLIEPDGFFSPLPQNSNTKKRKKETFPIINTLLFHMHWSKGNIKKYLEEYCIFSKEKLSEDFIKSFYVFSHTGPGANAIYSCWKNNYLNIDVMNIFKELNLPLYIIWGENAILNPPERMDRLMDFNPKAEYAIFEQTRAFPQWENPIEFHKIAIDFFFK